MLRASISVLGLVASLALLGEAAMAADPAAGQTLAKARCAVCHGVDGMATQPHVPHIAGDSEMYLAKQIRAFRDGERQDPQMTLMAQPLSDEDIANLSAWYSSIQVTATLPE